MSSSTQTPDVVVPNYAPIVTSQLIGSLLNFFFLGMLLVQSYIYRICFPRDALGIKVLVYFILLVMIVCICLNAVDVEYWFGSGFGQIARFTNLNNSRFYTPLMGSFVAMLVQLFFCYRIFVIRRTAWPLCTLIALIALAQCAGGMGGGIISFLETNEARDHMHTIFEYLWLISGAVAGILIAGTMIFLLLKAAVVPSTHDIVKDIVRFTIETNAFSAIVALLGLVLFVGVPNTTYFICPVMVLPGIYANTLLVALNNRPRTQIGLGTENASSAARSSVQFTTTNANTAAYTLDSGNQARPVSGVPPMSFAPNRGSGEEKTLAPTVVQERGSMENKWRDDSEVELQPEADADVQSGSGSEYEVDVGHR
ncbi:hypothetical protein B0H11DRAFT_2268084, partial [Mycena galericulata]